MKGWLALVAAALCAAAARCPAQPAATYPVESVKAAFLYRFLDYVEWPAGTHVEGPLTIAVLGDESLTAELYRHVRGRMAHGREIRVRGVTSLQEGLEADVLFVSAQWKKKLEGLSSAHDRDPVLIVTEGDGAFGRGSVINFLIVDGTVRFEVSLPAAEQRGLKLSSRLLSVALRVEKSGHRFEQPTPAAHEPYWVRQPHPLPERRQSRA